MQYALKPHIDSDPICNAALFLKQSNGAYLAQHLSMLGDVGDIVIVSDDPNFGHGISVRLRLTSREFGLGDGQLNLTTLPQGVASWFETTSERICLVVDMAWVFSQARAAQMISTWGRAIEDYIANGVIVLSCYDTTVLIEEQVIAAMAAHRQFLSTSGLYRNVYWMPELVRRSTLDEQLIFTLSRLVPDYAEIKFFERNERFAARGVQPDWLGSSGPIGARLNLAESWQICCLGQLRVYRHDGERINWKLKGGAPKKTRTLFAYLLTKGEKGVHADRLAELLWSDGEIDHDKRARLHHTIAMLRKTLGSKETVLRSGDFYRLNVPEGSWIDLTSFEQLCRRGISLFKRGQLDEALQVYRSAERLYAGDLFQDIPDEYIAHDEEDWCLPRRTWMREMALKLQRDMSALLRSKGQLRQALEHCQKALAIDSLNDDANIETMRVFHAQGRVDAVARHFRQYRKAMEQIDATVEGLEVHALYLALTRV